jgi:hypothetical protein
MSIYRHTKEKRILQEMPRLPYSTVARHQPYIAPFIIACDGWILFDYLVSYRSPSHLRLALHSMRRQSSLAPVRAIFRSSFSGSSVARRDGLETSCVCIVDASGRVVRELRIESEPDALATEALATALVSAGLAFARVGLRPARCRSGYMPD